VQANFTKRNRKGYRVDVVREFDPPARLQVVADCDFLPYDLARFVVEREFGMRLAVFGQLAAGGDAGTFWCAPSDRTALLAARAHRLRVTGRADLSRSQRLTAACLASWEVQTGRRSPADPWPLRVLHDSAAASPAQLGRVVGVLEAAEDAWQRLADGASLRADWPAALTLRRAARLRSA
jgi:hypothetical protein